MKPMKSYYRVMLGQKSIYSGECFAGNFIGTDFGIVQDLTNKLPEEWRAFNREFIPVYLAKHPDKTKIGAGLACGALWTVSKGIKKGDIVLCPDGSGHYRLGEVTGDYTYEPGKILFHRRPVRWLNASVDRAAMSEALRNSTGSIGTVSNVSRYYEEIEKLIGGASVPQLISTDQTVENPWAFALEEHLEDFLVKNWAQTELGKEYEIYEEDGEKAQQYPTDTGPLDILAISKDKKKLLVVELKKGRASDAVVGQTLRYMSYVQEEMAEKEQAVHGIIIALEDDPRMQRALKMVSNIQFYRYQVNFKLISGQSASSQ
jgi:restriction system protein